MRILFTLLLLAISFPALVLGQAVSRTELRNTNTLIDARMTNRITVSAGVGIAVTPSAIGDKFNFEVMSTSSSTGGISAVDGTNIALTVSAQVAANNVGTTVATISDLIALSPATNQVWVKAHSGTNGVGGGLFELRGTNGWRTNTGTVFASTDARKFWFRVNPLPLNPEWFGAKHDASTDDTLAIQAVLNVLTNGDYVANGAAIPAVFPIGIYKVTSMLHLTNHQPGWSFRLSGQSSVGRSPDGAVLWWQGSAGTTCFRIVGGNNSIIENMAFMFNTNKYGIHLDSTSIELPGTPGSSGMQFDTVIFTQTAGPGSSQVVLSHDTGGDTTQISEVTWKDCYFVGSVLNSNDHAVINLVGANTKNFAFYNCRATGFTNTFHFAAGSSYILFDNMVGGHAITNLVVLNSQLEINGWYDEGSSNFLNMGSVGANPNSARISGVEWHGASLAGNGDEIIHVQGALTLENSLFENARTATSVPNIVLDGPELTGLYGASVYSRGNYFVKATVPPFYSNASGVGSTSTNNWVFHQFDFGQSATYGNHANTNVSAMSFNDAGWGGGAVTKFKSYAHGGGNVIADYLHVIGSGSWWSNRLGVGLLSPTNTFHLRGHATLESNVFLPNLTSNASPVAFLATDADGRVYETAAPTGVGALQTNNNQFGANVVLNIKDGAAVTNLALWTGSTVNGATYVHSYQNSGPPIWNIGYQPTLMEIGYEGAGSQQISLLSGGGLLFAPFSGSATTNNAPFYIPSLATNTFLMSGVGGIIKTGIIGNGLSMANGTLSATASGSALIPFVTFEDDSSIGFTNYAIRTSTNIIIIPGNAPTLRFTNLCNGCELSMAVTNGIGTGVGVSNNVGSTNSILWITESPPASAVGSGAAIGTYVIKLHCTATNIIGEYYPPFSVSGSGSNVKTNAPTLNNATLLGTTTFEMMNVGLLVVASNTTEVAATAYVKHDLQIQGPRLVLTNSMTGNMVLQLTNVAGTTNSSFHFVFEGEAAGGTGRFITNTVNSIGNTIPVLLRNGAAAVQASPLVWSVPAGTVLECDLDFTFQRGTNFGNAITNLLTR